MNLGRLKRTEVTSEWKEISLAYPDLGWEFFEAECFSLHSRFFHACDFHEHDGPPPKPETPFDTWNRKCPYEGKETFFQYRGSSSTASQDLTTYSGKRRKKDKKKKHRQKTRDIANEQHEETGQVQVSSETDFSPDETLMISEAEYEV